MIRLYAFFSVVMFISLAAMDNEWQHVSEFGINEYGSVPKRPSKPLLVELIRDKTPSICRYCKQDFDSTEEVDLHILAEHNIIPGEQILDNQEYTRSITTHHHDKKNSDRHPFRPAYKRRKLNGSTDEEPQFASVNNRSDDDDER